MPLVASSCLRSVRTGREKLPGPLIYRRYGSDGLGLQPASRKEGGATTRCEILVYEQQRVPASDDETASEIKVPVPALHGDLQPVRSVRDPSGS